MKGIFLNPKSAKCSGKVMKPSQYHKFTILSADGSEQEFGGVLFIRKSVKPVPTRIVLEREGGLTKGQRPVKRDGLLYRQF